MIDTDLDAFFNTDEFAVEMVLERTGDVINVIFEDPYSIEFGVGANNPTILLKSDDSSKLRDRDIIDIQGTRYRVLPFKASPSGVAELELEKLSA